MCYYLQDVRERKQKKSWCIKMRDIYYIERILGVRVMF